MPTTHPNTHPSIHPFIIMCLLSEKDYHPQVDLVLCCSGGWLGEKADKVHCWRRLAPAQGNGSGSVGNRWRGVYSIQRNCPLSSHPTCCGLNVCVLPPPKTHKLEPNVHCDSVRRWGLQGREGEARMSRLRAFIKETPQRSFSSLRAQWVGSLQVEEALTKIWPGWYLDLVLPATRTVRNTFPSVTFCYSSSHRLRQHTIVLLHPVAKLVPADNQ